MDQQILDMIGQTALGLGVLIGGLFTGYQSVKARREAAQAARNAYPVSNGWGSKVAADLDYLRASLDRLHTRQDHTDSRQTAADEQRTDMSARVTDAARHAREAAAQSAAVSAGLTRHLADHAAGEAAATVPHDLRVSFDQ